MRLVEFCAVGVPFGALYSFPTFASSKKFSTMITPAEACPWQLATETAFDLMQSNQVQEVGVVTTADVSPRLR